MTENDDDRLDEVLRESARRDYHAPPPAHDVPRDEMWARIAAARAARGTARAAAPVAAAASENRARVPAAPLDGDDVAPRVIALPRRRWAATLGNRPAWASALAAALLLAVGIGVGRLSVSHDGGTPSSLSPSAPAAAVASGQSGASGQRVTPDDAATGSAAPPPPRTVAASSGASSSRAGSAVGATPAARRGDSGAEGREPTADESRRPTAAELPYRLAAAEHLALTETLLTTVTADARAGRADSSVALWARDLLGTTRMLLDSPAARDPMMARLLEDLELVLAEVAQLRPAPRGNSEDLQAIDRAVRQRGVLTRLRATRPAGPFTAGT